MRFLPVFVVTSLHRQQWHSATRGSVLSWRIWVEEGPSLGWPRLCHGPSYELALLNRVCLALWSDSSYVVGGVNMLLSGGAIPENWDNLDLWETVHEVALQLGHGRFNCQHVPSHLDFALCEDDFEAWVAKGNNWADTQADLTNRSRSQQFVSLHNAALGHFRVAHRRFATSGAYISESLKKPEPAHPRIQFQMMSKLL